MQKPATAVRAVHIPTGLNAVRRSERSQTQDRERALRALAARLAAEGRREEREQLRSKRQSPEFGNRIRSRVFLPKRFARDHRAGHIHPDPHAAPAGDLDGSIQACLEDHEEERI